MVNICSPRIKPSTRRDTHPSAMGRHRHSVYLSPDTSRSRDLSIKSSMDATGSIGGAGNQPHRAKTG